MKSYKIKKRNAEIARIKKNIAIAKTFGYFGPERDSLLLLAAWHLGEIHPDTPDAIQGEHPGNVLDICEIMGWPEREVGRMRNTEKMVRLRKNGRKSTNTDRD
jgi:hypothetical protein